MTRIEAMDWLKKDIENYLYICGGCSTNEYSKEYIKTFYDAGIIKVEVEERNLDEDDDENGRDAIFVTINPDKISKKTLSIFAELCGDEFDEIEPNVFRIWWD